MKTYNLVIIGMSALLLSSCQFYKKYEIPTEQESAIAADYKAAAEAANDSATLPYLGWREVFTDPLLQGYIQRTLDNNRDLQNAKLHIDQANAALKGAKLSYFPSAAFTPNVGGASYDHSEMKAAYTLPIAINWEVDAFGKILNRKRGAKVQVEQMEAVEQATRSQLVCGVASTYYALVLLHQQLELTNSTAAIWKDQVETMKLMMEAGWTNSAAVEQSQAQYYSILASIPDLEQNIHATENTLSLLMNQYPGEKFAVTSNLDFELPTQAVEGVPMAYLAARPDVKAQERALATAYYATNSARANFYPSLNISSNGGFTNSIGSMIVNPGKWFIQLAAQLTAPLFSRGQNIANLESAKAAQKIALNNFEYSVLNAASQVSDALVGIRTNAEKREYLDKQTESLAKAVEYSQELFAYNHGTSYLEVLTARSALLNSQMASLASWHGKVTSLISLYQAVGGGR